MPLRLCQLVRAVVLILGCACAVVLPQAQDANKNIAGVAFADSRTDYARQRNAWFFRGRVVTGQPSAELRRRAYAAKLRLHTLRAARTNQPSRDTLGPAPSGSWTALGPVPLASDASGTGVQDYHQVAGRTTAVVIDPADPSGNTVYIGSAQGGVWKSTNSATNTAANVTWTALTDEQATLSVGSIAIQPGNSDPAKTVILAGTGEADNSADSYFGLGILRSTDAGGTWTLIPNANSGSLSFSGLGGTRMAFSSAVGQTSTVVAAMATTSEGMIDGAVTANTTRGLYSSLDAGQTWTYNALLDPGNQSTDATSATSVVYNASAGIFLAAIRYHGFYSSPDGTHWTRLANQPSGASLSTPACPPQSTTNNQACPIFRGEITVVPGRNEMYAWFVSLDPNGVPIDGGIWQSFNGGTSWTQVNESGITNCGDTDGCGVQQGYYNLDLLAVPNGADTDLYAGAVNLYKCSIKSTNLACNNTSFLNLTHAYGCFPIAAPAHVHPGQHALDSIIPISGTDSGNALMYFANDGGIYRSLNGFAGLNTGSCSGTNEFEDLNQNLGSLTQFVSFSSHPTDSKTLLGGTQNNGSPATSSATTSTSWLNVNGGDGGFNAIDPATPLHWFVSNPDIAPGGLNIQECASGVNCRESNFSVVVSSSSVGGDDGGFYPPYILDPQSSTELLVGTCRLWRGPRLGGIYVALSPNFDTFGSGTCAGSEVNLVRAIAAGGPTDSNGSTVIYATTDGLGPLDGALTSPTGGHVWVTTNATGGTATFNEVSQNINPNQFPVSSVTMDGSDFFGTTAYVTIMGFTGGPGHVWKTLDGGATWTDFTGTGLGALPDSPANAVIVDITSATVYVGTDVGVFQSNTSAPSWSEVGPSIGSQAGFLPNAAVTALALFNSGGQKLLRASTYGRGVWQYNLLRDFGIAITNTPQTIFPEQTATFNGTVSVQNGYSDSITLSCTPGTTKPPVTCTPQPPILNPATAASFAVTAGDKIGDYSFNLQAVGADPNHITHLANIVLHVVSSSPDFVFAQPSPFPLVNTGSTTTNGPISITSVNGFAGLVNLSCSLVAGNGSCSVSPTSIRSFPVTANVIVNAANLGAGSYQLSVKGISGSITNTLLVPFNVADYQLSGTQSLTVAAGAQGTANLAITPSPLYNGIVNATCDASALVGATCTLTPANPLAISAGSAVPVTATIQAPTGATPGVHNIIFSAQDTSGAPSHDFSIALTVPGGNEFKLTIAQAFPSTIDAGSAATAKVTLTPNYSGSVTAACDATTLAGQCSVTPANPIQISAGVPATLAVNLNLPNDVAPKPSNHYNITLTAADSSGQPTHSIVLPLTVIQDFSVNSATPSQTINAGQVTGPYQLTVQPNPVGSSFNSAVTLSCPSGLPAGAQCNFTPNPVPVGSNDVVMSISTVASSQAQRSKRQNGMIYALWLVLPGLVGIGARRRVARARTSLIVAGIVVVMLGFTSCGASVGGGGGGGGQPPTQYTVTVTGTAGSISHSTTVVLLVAQ